MAESSTSKPTLTVLGNTSENTWKHPEEIGAGPFSAALQNEIALIRANRPREQPRRMKRKDAVRVFVSKLLGEDLGNAYIPFDLDFKKFVISADDDGAKRVLKIRAGDVLSLKSAEYLTATVRYAAKSLRTNAPANKAGDTALNDFHFCGDDYKKITTELMASFPYIKTKDIASFRFKTEPGYCWSRLAFEIEAGAHPTFDAIGTYLETPQMYDTLKWYIGELFNKGDLAQKILWMYGEGGNGKGTIVKMIERVFKDAFVSIGTDKADLDKHWTAGLIGKRIAVGTDVENIYIVDHPAVKAISGGDAVPVRDMNRRQVSMELPCQFIFTSNFKPHFRGKKHQARRLLYVGFRPGDPLYIEAFTDMVAKETPYFLNTCIEFWSDCKRRNYIPSDATALSVLEQEGKEEIHAYLDAMFGGKPRFLYGAGYRMDCDILWQFVQPKNHFVKADITRVLATDYGVKKENVKCSIRKRSVWTFIGMGSNF